MRPPLILWLLVAAHTAAAHSVAMEASAARGILSLHWTVDLELRPDQTYLFLGYGWSRPPPVEGFTEEGIPVPSFAPTSTHQLSAGLDHAWSRHWYGSVLANFSPRAEDAVSLGAADRWALVARRGSAGGRVSLAFDSAGISEVEFLIDGALSVTHHRLGRGIRSPARWTMEDEPLWTFRPSLGGSLFLGPRTELSLRMSYFGYSDDPLTTGRFTESELEGIEAALAQVAARLGAQFDGVQRSLSFLQGRLLQADAVSGFASAPLWWEAQLSGSYQWSRWLKGQLSLVFDQYVPTQGQALILSTKWTVRPMDALRAWLALAVQRDIDGGASGWVGSHAQTSGLVSLGAEYTF